MFVDKAGEDAYRIRASSSRVVWGSGFAGGAVYSKPFDGGPTTTVVETSQRSTTFDVEGETLVIVHTPSGIYRYDVTNGDAIGERIPLGAGGIAPVGVFAGTIYFAGNHEGEFNPDGPNYYPLVSSPLEPFGAKSTHATGIDGDDLRSILVTKTDLFFAGKGGVFRVEANSTVTKLVTTAWAASLTTDGEYLYWVADAELDGRRALMRSNLDGSEPEAVGPEKVLSVAAIPGRLFYAVEASRFDERVASTIMVLGTKP